ncbi:MAG: glutathione S-transferase family protein [Maricaulaceae bacterium]
MTKIYYHPLSFPSLTVVFAAEAMGIDYERKIIDLPAGEHKSEAYLAVNPYGKIPAMSDGDFNLSETSAIVRYLALRENSSLYGGDLQQQAKIDQWVDFIVQHIRQNVGRVHFNRVIGPMLGATTDSKMIDLGLNFLAKNLPIIEAQLEAGKYVCGDDMTLADMTLIASLEPADMAEIDLSAYPALQAYLKSVRGETFYTNVHTHYGAEIGK